MVNVVANSHVVSKLADINTKLAKDMVKVDSKLPEKQLNKIHKLISEYDHIFSKDKKIFWTIKHLVK